MHAKVICNPSSVSKLGIHTMNIRSDKKVVAFILLLVGLICQLYWIEALTSSNVTFSQVLSVGVFFPESNNLTFVPPTNTMTLFCVPWAVNTDDWWTHAPDWDVAEENDLFTCFRKSNHSVVWTSIYQNQFQNDCNSTVTRSMWSSGFGSDIENVALSIQLAMERHVPLTMALVPPKLWWHYSANKHDGSNATCPEKDMSCYFLPITNCQPNRQKVDKSSIRLTRKYAKDISSIYGYVTRQQQWLRKSVYDTAKPIGSQLTENCTVIHVRRADVILHGSDARKYYPIADYVNLLPQKTDNTVLLLTDDANAIDEALEFHPNIRWVYFRRKRFRGKEGGWENQVPSMDPKQEMIAILATLKLVPRCSTLIHSRSKFADALSRAMGPHVTRLQVDSNQSDVFHANNSLSELHLANLLKEKRRSMFS